MKFHYKTTGSADGSLLHQFNHYSYTASTLHTPAVEAYHSVYTTHNVRTVPVFCITYSALYTAVICSFILH